ncbi:MAG: PHP domain-containing protein [Clostridia bacterium]|nr:PHP domain-containing protein [Clostridia bacterium]
MPYKTELHLHTSEVSNCVDAPTKEAADLYAEAGYQTVVITNHMSRFTYKNKRFDHSDWPWERKVEYYMNGYHTLVEAAAGRFDVLLGMEFRAEPSGSDYLVYGVTEEFLLSCPDLMALSVKDLSALLHENNMLLYQAHPFRNGMRVTDPGLLDGIEVYNGHIKHDSRNDIAQIWADRFGLLQVSGTDFHHIIQNPAAGILTDEPIRTNDQLLSVLRGGNFTLIRGEA